jgi:DNA-binding GntR family transcriptional regulator
MPSPTAAVDISDRIIEAVMAQKLAPGTRLGEQQLAMLFDCSRTIVREALARLATRGLVTVSARRGWYVIDPSEADAREAFEARRVIETGLIRSLRGVDRDGLARLRQHIAREESAVAGDDVGARSFLLGDFHVCLAECLGNGLLADTLRDFTARTTLVAMRYQSSHDAAQSCADHVRIVAALAAGDMPEAERLMAEHIGTVQSALNVPPAPDGDPLRRLRDALAPVDKQPSPGPASAAKFPSRRAPAGGAASDPPDEPSTYLGALL